MSTSFRHIGKETPRPDARDKATGRAAYIHDLERPGMLYGKIKFSEHAHARIVRIEAGPEGFSVEPRLPGSVGRWRLRTQLVDVSGTGNAVESVSRVPAD